MKGIQLAGDHSEMGRQQARQVQDLRPEIVRAMQQRLGRLESYEVDLEPHAAELADAWEEAARPTLAMLRGIAQGLELEWEAFFRYTIASYLEDRIQRPAHSEGCTTWAASGPVTRHEVPMLVKNRDYRPDHQPLQCLARARPARGYRYTYVTSGGSPGVFSSGMNQAGLAVADTHVASLDLGPGLARYSVMMEILEHHSDVESALDYLRQVPHMGDGTLILIDAAGAMAVFEMGHTTHGSVRPGQSFVVSTNHFVTQRLRQRWVDHHPAELRGNSVNRHAKVVGALQAARGEVDTRWAQELMSDHGDSPSSISDRRQYAICRHADMDPRSTTISMALYLPYEGTLLFANGQPCRVALRTLPANDEAKEGDDYGPIT
jgi:isopenicillin-N N-acyltransferase-like protein